MQTRAAGGCFRRWSRRGSLTPRLAAGIAGALTLLTFPGLPVSGAGAAQNQAPTLSQARKDLLTLSDMPSGWTSTKNTNSNNNVGASQLAHCVGVATGLVSENPPSVNSKEFQNPDGTLTVTDDVTVFPSAKNAAAEFAVGANPKLPSCMTALASGPLKTKLFGKTPKGTTIGTPLVSAVSASAFGPGVDGYSLSVPVTAQGVTVNVTATQLIAVKGRLGHQVDFTSFNAPFSLALEQQIMQVATSRL
jgi:hypothetical protein